MPIHYRGSRSRHGTRVEILDGGRSDDLPPRRDLGDLGERAFDFEWGYIGLGPGQLALALLAHELGDEEAALDLYPRFSVACVAGLPRVGWTLSGETIRGHVAAILAERQGEIPF